MLPRIIDNERKQLGDTLKVIAKSHKHLSIATGYWDLPGTQIILNEIENYESIRLLIGQEPLLPRYKKGEPEPDFPDKDIFHDLQYLQQTPEHKALIVKLRELIDVGKLEVRVYKKKFFHAKAYIFGDYDSDENIAIVGSSNFTRAGLTGNTELNGLENDGRLIRYKPATEQQEVGHLYWFDQFWNEAEPWNGRFTELISTSPVGDVMFSPYEMYIASLYHLYNDELEGEELVSETHSLYEFQRRNANLLLRKLKDLKLAMLSDSVGLGKTITAGSVIDHYLNNPEGRQRVEIIVPAALKTQWSKELTEKFGLHDVSIISLQNEKEIYNRRQLDKDAEVKLFVIDEAHNLRSEASARYKMLFDWLYANPNSHVLLLTATPINNQLSDFANQIQLAAKGSRGAYKILYSPNEKETPRSRDFDEVIRSLDSSIKAQARQGKTINFNKVKRALQPALSHFMVRATRQGIEETYGGLKDQDGNIKKFPQGKVDSLPYDFTDMQAQEIKDILFAHNGTLPIASMFAYSLEDLLDATQRAEHPLRALAKAPVTQEELASQSPFELIFHLLLSLGLPMYRDMLYLHRFYGKTIDELREFKLEKNDTLRLRQQMSIHNIIRISYLKRLESSPESLIVSLERYQRRLIMFRDALNQGKLLKVKDIDKLAAEYGDDESLHIATEDNEEQADISEITHNIAELKNDIESDLKLISCAVTCAKVLKNDDKKLQAFADKLMTLRQTQPAGKKVLVFSFYADTIEYLKKHIPVLTGDAINNENAAFVSGKTRKFVDDYTRRFAPEAKHYDLTPLDTELDYLFSTDVLSEGQNLQDCGILINYDLHWNPVRMIQRNGRINRLGSPHKLVYVYNLHPQKQLEQYLRLVERLKLKINLIVNTVGTDQSVLGEKAAPVDFLDNSADEISVENIRNLYKGTEAEKQATLTSLEEEVDFSLGEDAFIADLRKFDADATEAQKYTAYHGVPYGKWGMLPQHVATEKHTPDALTLVNFEVADGQSHEIIGGHSRFFASKPQEGTFEAYDTLAALSHIKCSPEDSKRITDTISFDKTRVAGNITQYGTMLATSEYSSPHTNKLKPSYALVLDHMVTKLSMDTGTIYAAITEGANRMFEKELDKALRHAAQRIKLAKPLTDTDILAITSAAEKLTSTNHTEHQLQNLTIVYNYAKPK